MKKLNNIIQEINEEKQQLNEVVAALAGALKGLSSAAGGIAAGAGKAVGGLAKGAGAAIGGVGKGVGKAVGGTANKIGDNMQKDDKPKTTQDLNLEKAQKEMVSTLNTSKDPNEITEKYRNLVQKLEEKPDKTEDEKNLLQQLKNVFSQGLVKALNINLPGMT